MTADQFRAALNRLGWSSAEAAEYFPANVRTVNRYLDGTRRIPPPVEHLIMIALEKIA